MRAQNNYDLCMCKKFSFFLSNEKKIILVSPFIVIITNLITKQNIHVLIFLKNLYHLYFLNVKP